MSDTRLKPMCRKKASISAASSSNSGVGEVLDELDRELIGLAPVKTRIREIAALLLVERSRKRMGLAHRDAHSAYELHRQSRHRQDHGGAAHGRICCTGSAMCAKAIWFR